MQIHSDPSVQYTPPPRPTSYHGLHWESVNRVKDYLYHQLVPLLDDALARMETVERGDAGRGRTTLTTIGQRLEVARNALAAWAALITVESGGLLPSGRRLPLAASTIPTWLTESIRIRTTFTAEYKRPIFVHPEVFYESLLLLSQTGEEIGALLQITLADATDTPRGVWLRAVFVPPLRGAYSGMSTLLNALNARGDSGDAAFRLQVISSLMKINDSRLVLQNNRKTGEQALAALLPTLTTDDLRGSPTEMKRSPLRFGEREQHPSRPDSMELPTPFRLDEDTDMTADADAVPAFPPGALESWLASEEATPDTDVRAAPPADLPHEPPES